MLALIEKEKVGEYPGGARFRFERYAFLGGPIFFWVKKCLRAHLYASAGTLLLQGWMMTLAAAMRRFFVKLTRAAPHRTLQMPRLD
jgi:hypothetical protein